MMSLSRSVDVGNPGHPARYWPIPMWSGQRVEALDVRDAEPMVGAEVLQPCDHPVEAHHPRAGLAGTTPPTRLDGGGERPADARSDRACVAGKPILDVRGDLADQRGVLPLWGTSQGPEGEHAALAEDEERDAVAL